MSVFFAIRNASLIGHVCDEVVSTFKKDIIPYYIGASDITRDFLLSLMEILISILIFFNIFSKILINIKYFKKISRIIKFFKNILKNIKMY